MIATKGSKVYAVNDNPGRGGSFNSTVTLWSSPRDAALVFLVAHRGHIMKGTPAAKGKTLVFRNPQYTDREYYVETTIEELTRLSVLLEHRGNLSRYDLDPNSDDDEFDADDDHDEDDGDCDVLLTEVR